MDNRRSWSFIFTDEGGWIWRVTKLDGSDKKSSNFATLKECTADAMQQGYVAWKSEDERRRELTLNVTSALSRTKHG